LSIPLAIWPEKKAYDTESGWLSNRASLVISFAREGTRPFTRLPC
jgi:hypothetical protein